MRGKIAKKIRKYVKKLYPENTLKQLENKKVYKDGKLIGRTLGSIINIGYKAIARRMRKDWKNEDRTTAKTI